MEGRCTLCTEGIRLSYLLTPCLTFQHRRTLSTPRAFGLVDLKRFAASASRIIFSSGQCLSQHLRHLRTPHPTHRLMAQTSLGLILKRGFPVHSDECTGVIDLRRPERPVVGAEHHHLAITVPPCQSFRGACYNCTCSAYLFWYHTTVCKGHGHSYCGTCIIIQMCPIPF